MLELATTVITDLPQDSTLGQIKVRFAENEAPCPQPLLLQYLVAPNGSFYVNFDALCTAAFHLLVLLGTCWPIMPFSTTKQDITAVSYGCRSMKLRALPRLASSC